MANLKVAVITKGHPFEAAPFFAVFDSIEGVEWTHIEQPEALDIVHPERAGEFDVLVMYDMPGITFTGAEPPVIFTDPPPGYPAAFQAMLDRGQGMVFLHHAIAAWPAWPEYADIVGGRFCYQPGFLRGREWPDSGYRHDVTHTVEVIDATHPLCAGLEPTFEITDELYLFPVFESDVQPLMCSTFSFVEDNFFSADRAIRGERGSRNGWTHPVGSNLVAWTNNQGPSPLAYIQFGDSPVTYADANYRRVLSNAIAWAAQPLTN